MGDKMAIHYSSKTVIWSTPQNLFDSLNAVHGFTLDVCALPENAKCHKYYTPEIDGLKQDWKGNICWMNPPYGNSESPCRKNKAGEYVCQKKKCVYRGHHIDVYIPGIEDWVQKAFKSTLPDWQHSGSKVVCLLPARTETAWWHDYVIPYGKVEFIRGRLKFSDNKWNAPFPNAIVIFERNKS